MDQSEAFLADLARLHSRVTPRRSQSKPTCPTKGPGSLTIIGVGIRAVGQMTIETIATIRNAEVVYFLVMDPVAEQAIQMMTQGKAKSLDNCFEPRKLRTDSYKKMVELIIDAVQSGCRTCVISYGHPGVVGFPFHEALEKAQELGYAASMLPAISAEDCLFAELGFDPGRTGCMNFEANDFLFHEKTVDPGAALVLWQVGKVGDLEHDPDSGGPPMIGLLVKKLLRFYKENDQCWLYEASPYPLMDCSVKIVRIADLEEQEITPMSSLMIPPTRDQTFDELMVAELGSSAKPLARIKGGRSRSPKRQPSR